uniref:THAP domain-containing protein 1 n=1 Tax=Cyprinus carpio TaxID=7962 RepID=A0A8C2B6A5_CYPCA
MVFSCVYPGCFNIAKPLRLRARTLKGDKPLSFHTFPINNPERLKLWLLAIRWDVNTPMEKVTRRVLCSEHFSSEDYQEEKGKSRRLKSSAVPLPAVLFQPNEVCYNTCNHTVI